MNESKYNKSQPEFELATSFSRSEPHYTIRTSHRSHKTWIISSLVFRSDIYIFPHRVDVQDYPLLVGLPYFENWRNTIFLTFCNPSSAIKSLSHINGLVPKLTFENTKSSTLVGFKIIVSIRHKIRRLCCVNLSNRGRPWSLFCFFCLGLELSFWDENVFYNYYPSYYYLLFLLYI